jgi:polyhydroxybutyrate depolymerase
MRNFLTVLAVLVVLVALAGVLAWWYYLRADPMTPPALPGAVLTGSLQYGGHERSWLAYVPASAGPAPALVLVMHGSMGTGEQMRDATRYGFDVLAERHGFIAVYPNGYERHWNDCRGSADYAANLQNIDDVGFLRALVQRMVAERGVDPAQVFATGWSNGGQMAYRLGMEAPDLVSGIAAISANLPVAGNLDCEPSGEPVATMVINGTLDPVNPYTGGLVKIMGNASRGEVLSSEATARYWADLAGYTEGGEHRVWPRSDPNDATSVESTDWSAPGRVPISLVGIMGGGHTIPNPLFNLPRMLGPTSHQLDGPEVIWQFFSDAVPAPQ